MEDAAMFGSEPMKFSEVLRLFKKSGAHRFANG